MISMKFEGDDIAKALAGLSTRLSRKVLLEAWLAVAEPMAEDIERRAPREPGLPDLADNVQFAPTRVGEQGDVSVGIGVPRAFFYDWFQEYGTVTQSAHPFYRPTFDSWVNRAIDQFGNAVWTELAGKGIHRPTASSFEPVSHFGPFL